MSDRPIALSLFDFVDEGINELTEAKTVDEPLTATSSIRQFSINFYLQFFENVLSTEIQGVSQADAIKANVLARKNRGRWPDQREALVRRFQKLCKSDPDWRGGDYGGGLRVYRQFHQDFVPGLLSDIAAWAEYEGHGEIAAVAEAKHAAYVEVVEDLG
jgi:hypothetical protein